MAVSAAAVQAIRAFQALEGLPVTGLYDATTASKIHNYQVRYGLPVTGVVDPATVASINAYTAAKPPTITQPPSVSPGTPGTGGPVDPTTGLTGAQRDAATAITDTFGSYGLGSLAPDIINYLKQGYSPDTVSILLQQTPAYQQRFAANAARIKAGIAVLSPAQYLATESAYRQVMSKWGLPAGFYDSNTDFTDLIAKDVSPTEVDQRAQAASDFVNRNDPQQLAYFKQYYSQGDMIAYALDPNRAAPLVGKAFDASMIGGTASKDGINIGQSVAERLAGDGINQAQAQQGFGQVGQDKPAADMLGQIYGTSVDQNDLIAATFENDSAANLKLKKLASQERAAFGGRSGVLDSSTGKGSLSESSGGI